MRICLLIGFTGPRLKTDGTLRDNRGNRVWLTAVGYTSRFFLPVDLIIYRRYVTEVFFFVFYHFFSIVDYSCCVRNKGNVKMDEKTCKKRLDQESKPQSICARVGVWVFLCATIALLALILTFTLWTLVSYHRTVLTLQKRVDTLERAVEQNSQNMEQIIETSVQTLLEKVSRF